MNRAASLGLAFVVGVAGAVFACSSNGGTASNDSGPATIGDASIPDAGGGFVLDARPALPDAQPAGDSAPQADSAPACATTLGGACGLDPQCGCSPGETCDLNGNDSTSCTVAGTALAGHACVTTASCATGLTCIGGACRAYCAARGDAGCATAGGACVQVTGNDGGVLPGADVCTFDCALEDPNACGATGSIAATCVIDDVDAGTTDCALAGSVPSGGDCSTASCAPALVCVNFSGASPSSLCKHWCRVGQTPDDCGDAGTCQAFTTAVTVHGTQYGFCP